MMGRKYQVISADGHVESPPDPWLTHVPAKYRDRAPRLVHLPDGQGDAWIVEGQPLLHTGQNVTGPGPVRFVGGAYSTEDGSPASGTGGPVQRLHEQDQDGIDAEVLFPPIFATRFIQGIADPKAYLAMVQAYNTFLAEDYCSVAPDRLIGNAYIPVSGIDDAIAELERVQTLGLKSVTFRQFPNGTGSPKPEDDRFWHRAIELGMALSPHLSFGDFEGPDLRSGEISNRMAAGGIAQHSATHVMPGYSLAQMIVSGLFDRIPDLQFYFAEVNCALLPGMLYYLDRNYLAFNDWYQVSLAKKPSEYVLMHAQFGMVQEKVAIRMGEAGFMPLDWFMWGSDFPHSVGTYPNSRRYLAEAFDGIDEAMRRTILLENPASFFGLDLDSDITPTPAVI